MLAHGAGTHGTTTLGLLRQLALIGAPGPAGLAAAVERLRSALDRQDDLAGTDVVAVLPA